MKKKILIISFSPLNRDPRILRQILWLADDFQITTIGYTSPNVENVEHFDYAPEINRNLFVKLKRATIYFTKDYEKFYWNERLKNLCEKVSDKNFYAVIANDIEALPLASKIAGKTAKLILDAHEYSPLENEENLKFRLLKQPFVEYICKTYLPKVADGVTVCRGIADLYEENFGKKLGIVTNASEFRKINPSPVNAEKIRLIYHGGANPGRQLENQICMMDFLDEKYELNLMLLGDEKYIEKLKTMARNDKTIKFLPPVPFKEIIDFTNQFDIGIYSLAPTNTNNRLALPNKLFEYIQARLAIAISPSPEMQRIVENYGLGVVAEDFAPESLARVIEELSVEKIVYHKKQTNKHAFALSAEKNKEIFQQLLK